MRDKMMDEIISHKMRTEEELKKYIAENPYYNDPYKIYKLGAEEKVYQLSDAYAELGIKYTTELKFFRRMGNYLSLFYRPRMTMVCSWIGIQVIANMGYNNRAILLKIKQSKEKQKQDAPVKKMKRELNIAKRRSSNYAAKAERLEKELAEVNQKANKTPEELALDERLN